MSSSDRNAKRESTTYDIPPSKIFSLESGADYVGVENMHTFEDHQFGVGHAKLILPLRRRKLKLLKDCVQDNLKSAGMISSFHNILCYFGGRQRSHAYQESKGTAEQLH
ncbi:hypothetical protein POM88_044495 [Heracleum sosnowskyi]|uniref:Uncharacterized protein n=1 Tax=Heracleum sosnowskyi TaxID=360622 RepID=A0AAD8H456_9APIA|nr:hypothetical protein POM88_044495 [Heracleum sosnowskyi]